MINENSSDEQIVRQVCLGNIDSYRIIVERYQKKVFSIGIRFFHNHLDSEDFTQEVFLKAYENLRSFRGRSQFKFWLIRIAYNHGINRKNTKKTEPDIGSDQLLLNNETPERENEKSEIKAILERSIVKLPEKYRICLDLYFFWGLSYREIHEITHDPVNTIKSHVFRAKNILRNELKGTIVEDYHDL